MTTGRKILVANLGSTSFKYRLFEMPESRQLARGERGTNRHDGRHLPGRSRRVPQ